MPIIQLPYHKHTIEAEIPDIYSIETITPQRVSPSENPANVVKSALANPVDGRHLEAFKNVRSVAIAINDKTRPVPHTHLLPPLLEHLEKLGISPNAIIFVIATGAHPVMPPDQYRRILPENIVNQYQILCHDAEDKSNLVYLGKTSRKTPAWINQDYLNADLRIVVGNIEPHQFMGFSGGVKSAAIGLAGKETINHNHALMRETMARLGQYKDNPARADVEEIGQMIRVDFALNALLNQDKEIVKVLAGRPQAVVEAGIPMVQQTFQVEVEQPFDVMIISPGGYPKDINLYQAQKALAHAMPIMKPGGTIILLAACPEGTGSESYEKWMLEGGIDSYDAVFTRFEQEGFRVGPHKAFLIARDAAQVRVLFVSEMDDNLVRKLLLQPEANIEAAIATALKDLPASTRIGVMPVANTTIPTLMNEVSH